MSITVAGILVIPICLLCMFSPESLLVILIFTGGFEAAASLVIGSFGVQLNIIPSLLFMGHLLLLRVLGGRFVGHAEIMRSMSPLFLFLAIVVVGAMILPNLFAGGVAIWPQKFDEHVQSPLSFTGSNITQPLYVVLNIGMTFSCATYVASYPVRARRLLSAYFASSLAVVAVCLWQFASRVAGIPFPEGFFYSNPGWAILSDQSMGFGIPRINGPFSEPSALACFLSGVIYASGWLMLHGRSDRLVKTAFASAILGILVSTSTTGFAVVLFGGGVTGIYVLSTASADVARRFGRVAVPVAVAAIVGALALPIAVPNVVDAAGVVVQQTLTKTDSQSYDERTQADWDSLALLVPTYGLGTGWGSNRSSSLIPGVLGSAGIPGLGLIIWTILGIRREIRTMRPFIRDPADQWALQGFSAGLMGYFLAIMIAGPTITALSFYAMVGIVLGLTARPRVARLAMRHRGVLSQGTTFKPNIVT